MLENNLIDLMQEGSQDTLGPVTCLGITFENNEARRIHFTEELRKKLQDPIFRKTEGFPIGNDEEILNLSDPPYYTACPNPWMEDFIKEWEKQKSENLDQDNYHCEPFAVNVSEGKNDPIYNAHSYHTKVPHRAIMHYILHYTQPGDIVFDGFCGTGMTGIAAQMCGNREVVMSLGYQVRSDGTILQEVTNDDGNKIWKAFSKLGVRKAVLNDLSPAATFIAYNYNTPVDIVAFEKEATHILNAVETECSWMYETKHSDGQIGRINYTVWSDIFICSNCATEFSFWDVAVDTQLKIVKKLFNCPKCKLTINKSNVSRKIVSHFNNAIKMVDEIANQVPVFINYSIAKKRFEKEIDEHDLETLKLVDQRYNDSSWYPTEKMMFKGAAWGDTWRSGYHTCVNRVDNFYTKRNIYILSKIYEKIKNNNYDKRLKNYLMIWFTSGQSRLHKMNRYAPQHSRHVGPMANTYYLSSTPAEISPFYFLKTKISDNAIASRNEFSSVINLGSATNCLLPDNSCDYIFVDPPFGANIMYSELNFLLESWLRVWTNNEHEAIENASQKKGIDEYRVLMLKSFKEAYRILKPGRWMTVEFSNTNASVWNSIQSSLSDAGFIVANVSALDKSRGGLQSIIGTTAVKQDLVISAYKPNGGFEERFSKEAQTEEGIWDFVRTHLKYLPITKQQGTFLQFIPERDPRILFDQMITYYVRKGYPVPISSHDFQNGLAQRFIERDGMYFLPDEVSEYDRKKIISGELTKISLFVCDEATAIQWLRQLIKEKPQTFSDINPQFMQQLGGWSKNEAQLDLRELLNQNFLCYDGKGPVPEQIHSYLSTNWKELRNLSKDDPALVAKACDRWYVPDPNKAGDLEKLREKALLKEFEEYKEIKKKLKVFRLEAVRAGFKKAWQERKYDVIVTVADKIPNNVLEEDPKLLMWYDQAVTRLGEK
ncbi:DNA methyltransferase [Legionella pneumophila]|uniref:DNA methyltransferase n=1 Tax=Legionella pneumophila TaxID=446 RepID=UPI0007779EAA|nr:DNA methyltransferase [Legionella pneumophila]HAT8643600.1 DNA methylase [Legionella pneumophila]